MIRVAIAQAAPVDLDLEATLDKTRGLVRRAADAGASLVAFPETWLPGYPAWLDVAPGAAFWDHPPVKRLFARLRANSVVVPGPATEALADMAREASMVLVVGIHERVDTGPGHGTLYNSMLTIDADGRLVGRHRKLVPTYTEKLVWGPGDGSGLTAVDTAAGRIGGLVCWEHWMPLARQALHETAEQVHVATWPWVKDMHLVASRHYAFEGRCYVLACGALLDKVALSADLDLPEDLPSRLLRGGSAVIAPDGTVVAGPVLDEEVVLTADIDLGRIDEEHMTLDVTGHYARPDLLRLVRTGRARTEDT